MLASVGRMNHCLNTISVLLIISASITYRIDNPHEPLMLWKQHSTSLGSKYRKNISKKTAEFTHKKFQVTNNSLLLPCRINSICLP